jgi:hypothetical protein
MTAKTLRRLKIREERHETPPWAEYLLRHIQTRAVRNNDSLQDIDPIDIECLMEFQNYSCPIVGVPFILPSEDERKNHAGYSKWLNHLSSLSRRRAPVPVRADGEKPWQLGNILIISAPWAPVYELAGNEYVFHQTITLVGERLKNKQFAILDGDSYPKVRMEVILNE